MLKFIIIFAIAVSAVYASLCTEDCTKINKICNTDTDTCMCMEGRAGEHCEIDLTYIDCNKVLDGETRISIPRNHFNAHIHCMWSNNPNKITTVSVVSFDLDVNESCENDFFRILDKIYCGSMESNNMPRTFILKGRDYIEYVTDKTAKSSGFTLHLTYRDADATTSTTESIPTPTPTSTTPTPKIETEKVTIATESRGHGKSTPVPNCPLKAIAGKPKAYLLGGKERPCAEGTVFSLFDCTCIHEDEANGA